MPGIGISILLFAVGAILDFAVTVSPNQHGFNIHTVGVILMIVGAIGFVASLLVTGFGNDGWFGTHRHRTTIDDGQGNIMRREDVSQ
jgi:uncharacterized YccA/Bax inhibitor family protein